MGDLMCSNGSFRNGQLWDAWMAQMVGHETVDLRVMSSTPTMGIGIT